MGDVLRPGGWRSRLVGLKVERARADPLRGSQQERPAATARAILLRLSFAWRLLEGADEGDCGEVFDAFGFDEG